MPAPWRAPGRGIRWIPPCRVDRSGGVPAGRGRQSRSSSGATGQSIRETIRSGGSRPAGPAMRSRREASITSTAASLRSTSRRNDSKSRSGSTRPDAGHEPELDLAQRPQQRLDPLGHDRRGRAQRVHLDEQVRRRERHRLGLVGDAHPRPVGVVAAAPADTRTVRGPDGDQVEVRTLARPPRRRRRATRGPRWARCAGRAGASPDGAPSGRTRRAGPPRGHPRPDREP